MRCKATVVSKKQILVRNNASNSSSHTMQHTSIQVVAKSTTRTTHFQNQHLLEFGLKVNEIDVATVLVNSVRCQFCVYYGREQQLEQKVGTKRQRQQATTVKYWNSPFRTELYRKHHLSQHPVQWTAYQLLSQDAKVTYFSNKLQVKETLHSHFGWKNTHLVFNINASIVNKIIGDMFFHPDDYGGLSYIKAMKLFKESTEGHYT